MVFLSFTHKPFVQSARTLCILIMPGRTRTCIMDHQTNALPVKLQMHLFQTKKHENTRGAEAQQTVPVHLTGIEPVS